MDQLAYPLVTGFRHGFASLSAEFKIPGGGTVTFRGFKSIDYNRTRDRGLVRGNHPDPIGKTRGENSYDADVEVYLAEYAALQRELGPGYGDILFNLLVHFVEGGFTGLQDELLGCTLDSTEASNAQGTDALTRKVKLNPLKIKFDGVDDVEVPLAP
jgi:hypothetical protein